MLSAMTMLWLAATPAEAAVEEAPDAIAILNAQLAPNLNDVRKAAEQLKQTPPATLRPLATKHGKAGETLGIGKMGGEFGDPIRSGIYARRTDEPARRARIEQRLTALSERVSQCYGDPISDGTVATDSLGLRILVTPDGKAAAHLIMKAPQLASPRLDDCLGRLLSRTNFGTGKAPLAVDYTWTFKLGGNSTFRFDG